MNDKKIRIAKFLANNGICSRRHAEKLILEHKVIVNNELITKDNLGLKVDINDKIIVNNRLISNHSAKKLYFLFNKPKNVLCSNQDYIHKRKKVIDYFLKYDTHLYSVGRLDYDSHGLIIVTNDGDFAYKIMHPKFNIIKTYQVLINKKLTQTHLNLLQQGIILKNEHKTAPCQLKIIKNNVNKKTSLIEIKIHEGKKHQIKKMFNFFNYQVLDLKRIKIACFSLANIKEGTYQEISLEKINYFFQKYSC